jgi:hypothetical protein
VGEKAARVGGSEVPEIVYRADLCRPWTLLLPVAGRGMVSSRVDMPARYTHDVPWAGKVQGVASGRGLPEKHETHLISDLPDFNGRKRLLVTRTCHFCQPARLLSWDQHTYHGTSRTNFRVLEPGEYLWCCGLTHRHPLAAIYT